MPANRIIFLHIRKSAGTTFNSVLSLQYFRSKSYWITPENPPRKFLSLPQNQRDEIQLIRGHINFGCHDWFGNDSCYITVLRDPIKRIYSYLNYWKQDADFHKDRNENWFQLIRNHSPEELLSKSISPELENGMVRQLSGKGAIGESCHKKDLDLAIENLKKFTAFGITEYFDESLAVFSQALNWQIPIVYHPSKVRSRSLIKPTNYLDELIADKNALDQELYNFAVDLFNSKYCCDAIEIKAKKIRQMNRILSPGTNLVRRLKRQR